MTPSITSSITEGQAKQYRRFVEDATKNGCDLALQEIPLDKDGLQKLFERGDEFSVTIARAIADTTRELSLSNQFANEEVRSSCTYPKKYRVRDIIGQTNALRQLFSGVGFADEELAQRPLPVGAEGWFAIPRWENIAATYNDALQKVLALIKSKRTFYNFREGELGENQLKQTERAIAAWKKLGESQKGDILIVAAQFGLRHRGRSVRRAREVFIANEFGLGAFASGIMLLTHPEREEKWEQLHIDCAGDEFSPDAGGRFVRAPIFYFSDDRLEFRTSDVGNANEDDGSASGFLPQ